MLKCDLRTLTMKNFNILFALIFTLLVFAFSNVIAQKSTGINNTNPSKYAALHIKRDGSALQGIIIPKLSGADTVALKLALTSAEKGLIFYDTTNSVYQYWNGTRFYSIGGNTSSSNSGWNLTGNAGTNPAINFIGTTDNVQLRFRTNNLTRMILDSLGNNTINGSTAINGNATIYNATSTNYTTLKGVGDGTQFVSLGLVSDEATDKSWNIMHMQNPSIPNSFMIQQFDGSTYSARILITNAGNIGLSLPTTITARLHVYSNTTIPTAIFTNAGTGNSLRVNDNGTETDASPFVIDAAGNTGIGIAIPTSLLHVAGATRLGQASTTNGSLIFNNATNSNTVTFNSGVTTANTTYTLPTAAPAANGYVLSSSTTGIMTWTNASATANAWNLTGNTGTNPATDFIGTTDASDFAFRTGGTTSAFERMRILSGGNIGIGTSTPNSDVHIRKVGTTTLMIQSNDVAASGTQISRINFADGIIPANPTPQASIVAIRDAAPFGQTDLPTALTFWTVADNTSTVLERVRISNIGNVGIGSSAPSSLLSIGATNQFQVSTTGDIVVIKGLNYTWPTTQGAGSLVNDGTGTLTWANGGGSLSGTGTVNYLPIWTGAGTLGTSAIQQEFATTTSNVGIGGSPVARSAKLYVTGNATGYGIWGESNASGPTNTGIFGLASAATTTAIGILGRATGTSETRGVEASSTGSGTNAYGLYASVTGGTPTNAYGIYSNVTAGTNKYSGVFMGGNVGIGNNSPQFRLDMSNTPSDNSFEEYLRFGAHNTPSSFSGGIIWKPNFSSYTKISAAIRAVCEADFFRQGLAFYTGGIGDVTTDAAERIRIDRNGNVGIGTSTPVSMLSVGATSQFQVNAVGNIVKINNVTTSFPAANGVGILTNDGTGILTWVPAGGASPWTISGTDIYNSNTGNVGIGTSTPAKNAGATKYLSLIASESYTNGRMAALELQGSSISTNSTIGRIDFNNITSGPVMNNLARIEAKQTNPFTQGYLVFSTNNGTLTEKMRIDNTGRVGIGTTTFPYSNTLLQVGDGTQTTTLVINTLPTGTASGLTFLSGGTYAGSFGYSPVTGQDYLYLYHGGNALVAKSNKVTISYNGTNPVNNLEVVGNASIGSGYNGIAAPTNGMIVQGNVGIGTSTPAVGIKLEVIGSTRLAGDLNVDAAQPTVRWRNAAGTQLGYIQHNTNLQIDASSGNIAIGGNNVYVDRTNNRVGIGCITPLATLHVSGTIRASTIINTAAFACSDIRYKTEIRPISNSLNLIKKLEGKTYYWKQKEFPDWQFQSGKQYGFIAQEIEKILPSIVLTDSTSNHYKAVDYSRLSPILVEAVKEQQNIIDSLKQNLQKQDLQLQQLKGSLEDKDNQLKEQKTLWLKHEEELEKIKQYLGTEAKR
jgi:hypothetical protein